MPVPGIYDELLRIAYGDYMTINRRGGVHNYPVYEEQEKILKENIGKNPYRYTFSNGDLSVAKERENHKPTDELCREMSEMLHKAAGFIEGLLESGDYAGAGKLLEGSQGIAISLGTMLEERVSDSSGVVRLLEKYCELLYRQHESILSGYSVDKNTDTENTTGGVAEVASNTGLTEYCEEIREAVKRCLPSRKRRVLLLPCTARWWSTMRPYYDRLASDSANEIVVASVPYYEMGVDETIEMIDAAGDFSEDVKVIPVTEYDFDHRYADEIVIQIPYDDTNTAIRVPKFFYSDNLLKYTDKLTYIPYLDCDAPESGDVKAVKTLGTLIEQPAVVFSDKIIVGSEGLKELYIRRLAELAGDDTVEYWNGKLEVVYDVIPERAEGRKILMYYVDISYLLQYGLSAIDKMNRNMACFDEAQDKISCMFVVEDRLEDTSGSDKKINELRDKYYDTLDDVRNKPSYLIVSYDEAEQRVPDAVAYYGSAGVLAHKCRLMGKPVMIMGDVSIK